MDKREQVHERAITLMGRASLRRERTGQACEGNWHRQVFPTEKRERGNGDARARDGGDRRVPPVREGAGARARLAGPSWVALG
jgi:hypothetical protein